VRNEGVQDPCNPHVFGIEKQLNRTALLAGTLIALLAGGAPAFAEADPAEGWKVMSPVQLEQAAEAALPQAGQAGAEAAQAADPAPAGGGAGLAAPDPAAAEAAPEAVAPAPQKPAAKPKDDGPAYLAEDQPFQLKDYEEPKRQEQAPWWQTLLGFVFKLAIVLGLIFGSMVAVKKMSGGKLGLGLPLAAKGRNLVVLESASLGPAQQMHLVCVGGDRLIVVGSGPQGLSTLATIDDPHQVQALLAATNQKGQNTPFNQVYDMETVVQEADGDLFRGNLRDIGRGGRWGG
jgi:flagellar biogenesis protein FliO